MNKLRFGKHIICLLALSAALAAAGCGGGDKTNTGAGTGTAAASAGGSTVTGKVDLFSGFGVELDGAGRAAQLRDNAAVRLYRLQPDGASLLPLPDVAAAKLEGDTFHIGKAPAGERNLIIRVETADSKPILAAILPPIQAGDNTVVISPETDIEAALFQKIIQNGVRQMKDVNPWEFDAAFVKELVSDSMFFDMKAPKNTEAAADALLPVARAAYGRFLDTLMGKVGVAANDKTALKLLDALAGPMMVMASDYESGGIQASHYSSYAAALSRAARDAGLKSDQMSGEAVWTAARRQSLLWAARCIAGTTGTDGCPKAQPDASDFVPYGTLLEKSLTDRWNAEDMVARDSEFTTASATGAVSVSSLIAVKRLVALPEKSVSVFADALVKIDAEPDPVRRAELKKRLFQDIRDSLLLGVAGMDLATSAALETSIAVSAKQLEDALNNPSANASAAGAAHSNFLAACNLAFQPLTALLNTRYPKLEKTDLGKLDWAFRTIILNATLFDLSPVYYTSMDTDGDGAPDNEERVVGTDPASAKSTPAPVLVVTPASMLPAQPDDKDGDGFFDVVENAAGTKADDVNDTPKPGWMALCGKPSSVCLAPLPETVAESAEVDGVSNYLTFGAQGVYAGLYDTPFFTGRAPVALASAETMRDGKFKIEKVKPGRYFIAGFTDTSGSGQPESGDAAGYAGGDYPRRITTADGTNNIVDPITILGVLGKAKCPADQFYNPASSECVSECPADMDASKLLRSCRCKSGYLSPLTSSCVEKCPDTFMEDRAGTCVCPPGMQLEKSPDGKSGSCAEIKKEQPAGKTASEQKAQPKDEKASTLIQGPPLSPVTDKTIPGAATGALPVLAPPVLAPVINLKTQ